VDPFGDDDDETFGTPADDDDDGADEPELESELDDLEKDPELSDGGSADAGASTSLGDNEVAVY
jgi:hypothetical protein